MTKDMPTINLDTIRTKVSEADYNLIVGIVANQGKNKGKLRASKPPIPIVGTRPGTYVSKVNVLDYNSSCTAYIWRMVAFQISPLPQHQCLPITADFDLEVEDHDTRRELSKRLDSLVSIVVDSIPKQQWHGIKRWGEAFGLLGTPRYNSEGSTVYRIED